jgi:hypothetical protein
MEGEKGGCPRRLQKERKIMSYIYLKRKEIFNENKQTIKATGKVEGKHGKKGEW